MARTKRTKRQKPRIKMIRLRPEEGGFFVVRYGDTQIEMPCETISVNLQGDIVEAPHITDGLRHFEPGDHLTVTVTATRDRRRGDFLTTVCKRRK